MKAPSFSMPDQDGTMHSLRQYKGQWIILYFYPKDDTPGCSKEACSFRDAFSEYSKREIVVLGVSADSSVSHKKFAQKFHLKFPLLSDPEKETIRAYGAWGAKKFMGKEYEGIIRKTFIISPEGEIVKEFPSVTPAGHAEEILKELESHTAER